MASGKYSGAFIPGAGDGDELPPAPTRKLSLQEKYGGENADWQSRRNEDKARLKIWMNGREPVGWWEHYENAQPKQSYYCMEFPTTVHYFVVAWERSNYRPLGLFGEMGKLYVWCFGCKDSRCGACEWIRNAYIAETRQAFRRGDAREDALPF